MTRRRPASILAAAAAALLLALAACGSNGSTGAAPTSPATMPPTTSVEGGATSPTTGATSPAATGAQTTTDEATSPSAPESPATTPASPSAPPASPSAPTETSSATTSPAQTGDTALPASCTPSALHTQKAGILTISTDEPVYEPWFVDDKPENGQGYESAVAYAVADKLGYPKDKVTWVRNHFDDVISPAPKNFDFSINEFSITPARQKVVGFSSGYYDVAQAVITVKGSKIEGATSIADLQSATLGAQIGTTSLDAITDQIKTSAKPAAFQTNDAGLKALQNNQIDGLVVDLPTAFYMTSAQLDNGVIVGQLPVNQADPEQFGLLLDKGSALTACTSAAVDALRADGTLAALETQWLAKAGAPVLQ